MVDIDINPSSIGPTSGLLIGHPMESRNGPSAIGSQLFGSSAVL